MWASETANNASLGGALIPMMALGIPGDGITAMLIAGLTIHGLQAGPLFMTEQDVYKRQLQEQGFQGCYMLVYHYLMGPSGMDETMVKEMNAAMQAVVEDPTVNEGIAGIGHIPGWHDLEESEELHQKEYDELVEIAKSLDMYVQG